MYKKFHITFLFCNDNTSLPSVKTKESTRIFSITNYRIEKAKNGGD